MSREYPANRRRSHHIGMIGEGRFIAWAAAQDWDIYRGVDGHTKYDYIVDTGDGLLRVEVKMAVSPQTQHGNDYYQTTRLCQWNPDYVFFVTPIGTYWIPLADLPSKTLCVRRRKMPGGRVVTKYEKFKVDA